MEGTARIAGWHSGIKVHLHRMFDETLHSKRIDSLADATLGVMGSTSLAVSIIGHFLAEARGLATKHATKQVDRLLSNEGIDPWQLFTYWVPEQILHQKVIWVAMDWTEFSGDDQVTLALNLVTSQGRATPLVWLTVWKYELKGTRNEWEYLCLRRLAAVLPEGVTVTILADRGFGDHKLFEFIKKIGFEFVIRIRDNIFVTAVDGETRLAGDWVGKGGRARTVRGARVTAELTEVGAVISVHAKDMKDPWCLVASDSKISAREAINCYAKRWTIEPNFRDTKDIRFGMGLSKTHVNEPQRRDRLLLLNAFAISLLTLLGSAGESLGMDRMLKVNTVKRRTHSLFRQGCMLYGLIPMMPEHRLRPLMQRFEETLLQTRSFSQAFSTI